MIQRLIFYALLLFCIPALFAQIKPLNFPVYIKVSNDTLVTNNLKNSLNGFLSQKENLNKDNTYVLREDLLETSLLLDEIKEIEKSSKYKDDNFYKGYLTNVVQLDDFNFLVQFSYMGINDGSPVLGASFELLAKQKDKKFYFSSPLKRNTTSWKSKQIENCTFHYKTSLNLKTASYYVKTVAVFDKKLNSPKEQIEWYGFNNLSDILQNVGVDYKLDYVGMDSNSLNASENNTTLLVNGTNNESFDSFDPHDLWHERVRNVVPRNVINKPVDEGCAYLYGGSWGISWKQILIEFKKKIASNPNIDWLSTYDEFYNFGESREKHLLVPYVINALIVEKIEKEKDFSAVMELLQCGKYQKGNENYFKTLEKLISVNKTNYNDFIWMLIKESKS